MKNLLTEKTSHLLGMFILLFSMMTFTHGCSDDETITDMEEVAEETDDTTDDEQTEPTVTFVLTDTGQDVFYDADGNEISTPSEGEDYYGQDAQFSGTSSSFQDNGDGTVTVSWVGEDLDDDLINYDVYIGTSSNLELILENTTNENINYNITAGEQYIVEIVSKDSNDNTSTSRTYFTF